MKPHNNKIILGWDIVLICLFLVIVLAITSVLYYRSENKRILASKYHELEVTNRLKEIHIQSWQHYQLSNAETYSYSPIFAETIENYLNLRSVSLKNRVIERCKVISKYKSFRNIIIANTIGGIEVSLNPVLKRLSTYALTQLNEVVSSGQAKIGNFSLCPEDQNLYIDVMSPVTNSDNKIVAILILRIDPIIEIISKFRRDPVIENDEETFLAFKLQNQLMTLYGGQLPHDSAILAPLNDSNPLSLSLSKKESQYKGIGINNKKVIAHIQPVSGTAWYIISQTGYNEVLTEFHHFALVDSLITGILIILLLVTVVLVYQYRQKTIYKSLLSSELAFKEERERFRTTLYSIGDGVITTDESGYVMHMNSEATKLTGWKEADAIGRLIGEVFSIINEETRSLMECPVNRVLHDGVIVGLANHTLLISRDRTEYPISDSGAPIRNDDGKIIGAVLVFRDQSLTKEAERKLRNSNSSLEEAQTMAKIGSWEGNLSTSQPSWSKEMYRIHRWNPELAAPSWDEYLSIVHPDDRETLNTAVMAALLNSIPYALEYRLKQANEYKKWVKAVGKVEFDSNGMVVKLVGTVQDITEQKHTEETLNNNIERWQSLFNNSPSAIAVYRAIDNGNEFIFNDINHTSLKIENIKAEEIIGKKISEAFPAARELGFIDIFKRVWETGRTEYMDTTLYHDDRITGWRENIIYKLSTGEIVAIYNDITVRMEAELKLRQSELKFRQLFENAADPILLVTFDGTILDANPVTSQLLGYTIDELKSMKTLNLNTEEYKPKIKERLEILNREGALFFETAHVTKSGNVVFFEISSKVIDFEGQKAILSVYRNITQRKQAETALRESEEKFRNIFQNHAAVKLLIDPETGNIVDANQAAANFYGWSLDELKQMKIHQINTLASDEVKYNMENVLSQKRTHFELQHKLKNASIRDVEVFSSIIIISGKTYLHSIVHDITERKKAETLLKESEFFLKKSQHVARLGSYFFNIKTGFWSSSEMLNEVFGIPADYTRDLDGWINIIHPDFKEEMGNYITNHVISQKYRFDKEYKIIRLSDKQERWVHGQGELDFDKDGNPASMVGTIHDITEKKNAEILLKESEVRLQYLLNSVTDYIYSVTIENGKVVKTLHGEGCKTLTGYSTKEFANNGNLWIEIVHPDDKQAVLKHSNNIIRHRIAEPLEHRIINKSGKVVWIRNAPVLKIVANELLVGYDGMITNITEQKQLEQQILSSVIETEERERLTFSQELHDGLGPLISATKMYLQLLSVPNIEVDVKDTIQNTEALIEEASRSVREISFKLSPHILQNYGIEEALNAYVERIKETKNIEIRLTYSCVSRLNNLAETVIYRVLCECINNTIKHAKAKKIAIDINCVNDVMEINYTDNGRGFDVEKILKEHKGIGLMNMQSRIKSINGDMNINSAPGSGTNINIKVKTLNN